VSVALVGDDAGVADALVELGLDRTATRASLRQLADVVGGLPDVMRDCGVPAVVIERCADRIVRVARALASVAP
jgi:hypothetical protein